jgi:hypothetical protein
VARAISPVHLLAPLAVVAGLAACKPRDVRVQRFTVGISKDSVSRLMEGEKPVRVDSYLTGGHFLEILYFRPAEESESAVLPDRKLFPVVVVDSKVQGWGWTAWDSVAAANKIVVAPKPKS